MNLLTLVEYLVSLKTPDEKKIIEQFHEANLWAFVGVQYLDSSLDSNLEQYVDNEGRFSEIFQSKKNNLHKKYDRLVTQNL